MTTITIRIKNTEGYESWGVTWEFRTERDAFTYAQEQNLPITQTSVSFSREIVESLGLEVWAFPAKVGRGKVVDLSEFPVRNGATYEVDLQTGEVTEKNGLRLFWLPLVVVGGIIAVAFLGRKRHTPKRKRFL